MNEPGVGVGIDLAGEPPIEVMTDRQRADLVEDLLVLTIGVLIQHLPGKSQALKADLNQLAEDCSTLVCQIMSRPQPVSEEGGK